jgi:hypothetical protein
VSKYRGGYTLLSFFFFIPSRSALQADKDGPGVRGKNETTTKRRKQRNRNNKREKNRQIATTTTSEVKKERNRKKKGWWWCCILCWSFASSKVIKTKRKKGAGASSDDTCTPHRRRFSKCCFDAVESTHAHLPFSRPYALHHRTLRTKKGLKKRQPQAARESV